jgi:hypothetical protein
MLKNIDNQTKDSEEKSKLEVIKLGLGRQLDGQRPSLRSSGIHGSYWISG